MCSSEGFVRLLAVLVCAILVPMPVAAQVRAGSGVGGFVSGSLGDGGPTAAVGISGAVRLTQRFSIDVDASYVPELDLGEIPVCPPEALCILASGAQIRGGSYAMEGRARSVYLSLVADLPWQLGGMRPYVSAGGGMANVRRELRDTLFPYSLTRSSTDPMLTIGGGVNLPAVGRIILAIDARYVRIAGDDQFDRSDVPSDLNLTQIGVVVRYRF
jgi:hypothetical protein